MFVTIKFALARHEEAYRCAVSRIMMLGWAHENDGQP
jgi:hypothetical protein